MNEQTKADILSKNQKLIDMVIERAKRDFADDIAIIGLSGSFSTNDYHEKSDLDLIIINNTKRGWEISSCFILGDVGYDIYCTPWETRIEAQSKLENPMISCLVDLQILYCAKPEYMDRLKSYQQKALDELAKPIGKACLNRAKKDISLAKQEYANAAIAEELGDVRYSAGSVLYHSINAIVSMNNTYIKRGVKRYLEELSSYKHLPTDFFENYMAIIDAKDAETLRQSSLRLLKSLDELYKNMSKEFVEKPIPTYENLRGTYEELWCNYRNKVLASCDISDKSYAFHSALAAQNYLDEMAEHIGTHKYNLMKHFDSDNLQSFKGTFLDAMDDYLKEYERVGREVVKFDTPEELYIHYMNTQGGNN